MPKRPRSGHRWKPPGGWPLDEVLVGVATLRTLRELFRRQGGPHPPDPEPLRAWDVALRSPVSVPGAAASLERLEASRLVTALPPRTTAGAERYRLDPAHPLLLPLGRVFEAERRMVPPPRPYARFDGGRPGREGP